MNTGKIREVNVPLKPRIKVKKKTYKRLIETMNEVIITNVKRMFTERKLHDIQVHEEDDDTRVTAKETGGQLVMVKAASGGRLNINAVKECIGVFTEEEVSLGIILYEGNPTASAKNTLHHVDSMGEVRIQIFHLDSLKYCLLDHRLTPRHIKLTKNKAVDFKKKYDVLKIPVMLSSDPVAKFMYYRPGDIIEIHRRNGYVSYRLVKGSGLK